VPSALYLGIIAGLVEIIPTLGPIIATVPAVIVALVQRSDSLPISNLAFAGVINLFPNPRTEVYRENIEFEALDLVTNDTFMALKIHDSLSQDGYPVGIKIRKDKN
jgi:hypothetical protein